MRRFYPKSCHKRLEGKDPALNKTRNKFFRQAGKNFALLQLLFLGLFCYVLGSLFQQSSHTHNISVVFVDYDGGAIGSAVRGAYQELRGQSFPTLIENSPSGFTTPKDLEDAVCKTNYWAALYITPGASGKLQQALAGNVTDYQRSNVMSYIWNEAFYSAVVDYAISANFQTLSSTARVAYTTGNGTGGIQQLSSPEAISVFSNPWVLENVNIQPTTQGSRAIYNTLVIILIMIQEFFYLGTINGLYAALKAYSKVDPYRIIVARNVNSLAYCLMGSLCTAGAIWAFRSAWNVSGTQFVLSWMTLWLFAHLNFLTMGLNAGSDLSVQENERVTNKKWDW